MIDIYKFETPCYILDENEFIRNIQNFYKELKKYFQDVIVGYSFKTNSLPRLLYLALKNGCFAEVVSDDEYKPLASPALLEELVSVGRAAKLAKSRLIYWAGIISASWKTLLTVLSIGKLLPMGAPGCLALLNMPSNSTAADRGASLWPSRYT